MKNGTFLEYCEWHSKWTVDKWMEERCCYVQKRERQSRKGISLTMGYCHPLRRKKALAESRNNEACNEMTKSFRPITKHITKTREKKSGKRRRGSFRYFSRLLERKSGYVEESVLKKCMIIQSVQTQFVSFYVNINSIF